MNRLDLRQLREECSDVIAVSWVGKMYSELDAPTQAILHVLDDLVITDIRTAIANLDIVLKEGCAALLLHSNPDTIELLLKFFDDLLTELISDKSCCLFVLRVVTFSPTWSSRFSSPPSSRRAETPIRRSESR